MDSQMPSKEGENKKDTTFLVAVDFSHCSRLALRKAKEFLGQREGRIIALHVIDHDFVEQCIKNHLGSKDQIKKNLFIRAKTRLEQLLSKEEMNAYGVEAVVCEGMACIEINKKAIETNAEMIIMGSQGKSGDMKAIFFGSTTERVLRFITRPVLCVPPEAEYTMG
jgi:nucleotide-binding universal stress UspA family protein